MNDSLMTNLYVRYHPKIVVCACLHLSARILGISLPNDPAWYEIFGVGTEEIYGFGVIIIDAKFSHTNTFKLLGVMSCLRRYNNRPWVKIKQIHAHPLSSQAARRVKRRCAERVKRIQYNTVSAWVDKSLTLIKGRRISLCLIYCNVWSGPFLKFCHI